MYQSKLFSSLIRACHLMAGLLVLIVYDQFGGWLMHRLQWPIPGSVVGMILLLITLVLLKNRPRSITLAAAWLLRYMAFLFVPAGVGLILLLDLIVDEWLAMLVSIVLSTVVSLLLAAWLLQLMLKETPTPEVRDVD